MATIHDRYEAERGCGYRKEGGLYMVTDGLTLACGALPYPLEVCAACGSGVKQSRGWTWIQPAKLFADIPADCGKPICPACPVAGVNILTIPRAGLLWIGKRFYRDPADWLKEAVAMGISRRVSAIPRDFVLGETWVFAAHRAALLPRFGIDPEGTEDRSGVIAAFQPSRIEYVVRGDEADEDLDRMEERGITLVRVHKKQEEMISDVSTT